MTVKKRIKGIRRKPGRTKKRFKKKASKKKCSLTKAMLHGVPHGKKTAQVRKLSKTQKRPTGMFGGILSASKRKHVFEEAIKVRLGIKPLEAVSLQERNFVEQALQQIKGKRDHNES